MGKFSIGKKKAPANDVPRRRGSTSGASGRAQPSELDRHYSFRRNRTLTGSTSSRIASGSELNAEIRSPRAHVHHLSSTRRRLWFYFITVIIICIGLYVFLSQAIATTAVRVAGTDVLLSSDQSAYLKSIDSYFAARPAERMRFTLNTDELLSHMQATNPEVKAIAVSPTGEFGKAEVRVTARTPIAKWSINGNNQYVDDSGIVFVRNFHDVPSLQIVDNSGIRASNDQVITSNRFLGFVGRVVGLSAARGLTVTKVTIPTQTTRQVDIQLRGIAQRYKLSVDRSTGEQVEDISRVTSYLKSKGIVPSYVDVRIQGKAFYR